MDVRLTASVSDPDGGVTGTSFTWERSDDGRTNWVAVTTGATYTPVEADEAKYLRVTVTYDDNQGSGRSLSTVLGPVAESTVLSDDNSLSALSLSGLSLSPTFTSGTTTYTVSAGYPVVVTTLVATAAGADDGATVQISVPDADTGTAGHQVALAVGATEITITVTAENGDSQDYTLTVTRAQPTVTIAGPSGSVTEGSAVRFTVTRSAAAADALEVKVVVAETGEMVAAANEVEHTVAITAGNTTANLDIPTTGDEVWEVDSSVSATISASSAYTIGTAGNASQTVSDDDFPEATATLTANTVVDEGATVTATVTVTTERNEQPHEGTGPMRLRAVPGTATSADFGALNVQVSFAAADFAAGDGSNGCDSGEYCATSDHQIAITDDTVAEAAENFTIALERVDPANPAAARTDSAITIDAATTPQTVTINPSDRSDVKTLSALSVDGTALTPASDGSYSATVDFADEQVTIAITATAATAIVAVIDSDNNEIDSSASTLTLRNRPLALGANSYTVQVTAQDTTVATYPLTLTRSDPVLTLTVTSGELTEGDDVVFTVTRDGAVTETTDFTLTVTETGDMATSGLAATPLSLTIASGQTTVSHTVNTDDDSAWEPHSEITAVAASAYGFAGGVDTVSSQVLDDDFPAAQAVLVVAPTSVTERPGAFVSATVSVTTTDDQQPHKGTGVIRLATVAGTASVSDFTPISSADGAVSFDAADFTQVDVSGQMRWQASRTVQIDIVDDAATEDAEQFEVTMALVATGTQATDPGISLGAVTAVTVTIDRNDRSNDATLSSLGLSAGVSDPAFTPGTLSYAISVPFDAPQITISPVAADANALPIEVLDGTNPSDTNPPPVDDNPDIVGAQVNLQLGTARLIAIRVTAENEESVRVYRLTINRELPELQISIADDQLSEGDTVVVTVERNAVVNEPTTFALTVAETGTMVEDALEQVGASHLIQAGERSYRLEVPTIDDTVWDATSTVSVELVANAAAYSTLGALVVSADVTDDDFPEAAASLALSSTQVDEGQPVTATVTVTTARDEQPNADGGSLQLSTTDGPDPDGPGVGAPATAGADYRAVSPTAGLLRFVQSDFVAGDGANGCAAATYCASKEVVITTIDDLEAEGIERFTVGLAAITTDPGRTNPNIEIDANSGSLAVDIVANDLLDKPGLSDIGLSHGEITPAFVSTTTAYAVSVGYDRPQISIAPTTTHPEETFAIFGADGTTPLEDADPAAPGFQIDLPVASEVVVNVVTTGRDLISTETYTFTITRQLPQASVSVTAAANPGEGAQLTFTVTLNGPVEAAAGIDLDLALAETGAMLPPPADQSRTPALNIAQGATEAELVVATVDDELWEEPSTITLTLNAATGVYTLVAGSEAASAEVFDDDFPVATAEVVVSPATAVEGGSVTVWAVITTGADHEPREGAGTLLVSSADATAVAGEDYTAIGTAAGTLVFAVGDFVRVDIDANPGDSVTDFRWRASKAVDIRITDDRDQEPDETFEVALATVADGTRPTDSQITVGTGTATVTIAANDAVGLSSVVVHKPGDTSAAADVSIANPSQSSQTVYVRYRPSESTTWLPDPVLSQTTTSTSVQFSLSELTPSTLYVVQASLDSNFPMAARTATRFTTLGPEPSVSDITIDPGQVSETGADVTVHIANVAATAGARADSNELVFAQQTTEQTVMLRYRYQGASDWEPTESVTTAESSVTFHLTGLQSGSSPEIEATIESDFDQPGVQRVVLQTDPPNVSTVEVDAATITTSTAVVRVTVSDRNGDTVYLRFSPGGGWLYRSLVYDVGGTADTFALAELVAGTEYEVQASFDPAFSNAGVVSCARFTTDTTPEANDGAQTSSDCRGLPSAPTSAPRGGPGGGGPGGGGPGGGGPGGGGAPGEDEGKEDEGKSGGPDDPVPLEEVLKRDRLVFAQEALLNVYRCMFDVDVELVPGGCIDGAPAEPAEEPVPFEGEPTVAEVAVRDKLVWEQEALLNVYRCLFDIDTQIVPGGCIDGAPAEPVGPPSASTYSTDPPAVATGFAPGTFGPGFEVDGNGRVRLLRAIAPDENDYPDASPLSGISEARLLDMAQACVAAFEDAGVPAIARAAPLDADAADRLAATPGGLAALCSLVALDAGAWNLVTGVYGADPDCIADHLIEFMAVRAGLAAGRTHREMGYHPSDLWWANHCSMLITHPLSFGLRLGPFGSTAAWDDNLVNGLRYAWADSGWAPLRGTWSGIDVPAAGRIEIDGERRPDIAEFIIETLARINAAQACWQPGTEPWTDEQLDEAGVEWYRTGAQHTFTPPNTLCVHLRFLPDPHPADSSRSIPAAAYRSLVD